MESEHARSIAEVLLELKSTEVLEVARILGGKNNQAYRVDVSNGSYFMKIYHQDPDDLRRRGDTEYRWIETLWESGVQSIPKPVRYYESQNQCAALYEFIPGKSIELKDLKGDYVDQALQFLIQLNSIRNNPKSQLLPPASEACFSMNQHLKIIEKRVERLSGIDASTGLVFDQAHRFVSDQLQPVWKGLLSRYEQNLKDHELISDKILSPSDFGFHNALIAENGKIRFIDFEYAGWDDPAKLICDFFNQVAVPIPKDYFPFFLKGFSKIVPDINSLADRVEILYPFYRIKWVCILLNHFLPSGSRRKKFALQNSGNWESLLNKQLQSAVQLLETL